MFSFFVFQFNCVSTRLKSLATFLQQKLIRSHKQRSGFSFSCVYICSRVFSRTHDNLPPPEGLPILQESGSHCQPETFLKQKDRFTSGWPSGQSPPRADLSPDRCIVHHKNRFTRSTEGSVNMNDLKCPSSSEEKQKKNDYDF